MNKKNIQRSEIHKAGGYINTVSGEKPKIINTSQMNQNANVIKSS